MRSKHVLLMAVAILVWRCQPAMTAEDGAALPESQGRDTRITLSPLVGVDRNKMNAHGARGEVTTQTDTAAEYGLFFMVVHKNLVLTDFAFWTDVNKTDVFGNFAFANLYGDRGNWVTWNVGAGHLYHKIEPQNEEITVNVPMLKAGPVFSIPEWNLTVNPYVGYAWERIETMRADIENDSYLYGITVGWRWRMMGATVKYYYQDSQETDDDYQTIRARAHTMFNDHWGAVVRFDYMEHSTSDDSSVLLGPVYVF